MKSLKTSILEKLDINKVNLDDVYTFPLELTDESLVHYLKDCGYAEVPYISVPDGNIFSYIPYFNEKHGKQFIYTKQWREIYIADTSKSEISLKNPMFYLSIRSGKPDELKAYFKKGWSKKISQDEFRKYFEKGKL